MAAVDYEAVVLDLKREMAGRQGIGRGGLLTLLAELEVRHAYDEANVEQLLRRAAPALGHQLRLRAEEQREDPSSPREEAAPSPRMTEAPDHRDTPGGAHDGRSSRSRRAAVA